MSLYNITKVVILLATVSLNALPATAEPVSRTPVRSKAKASVLKFKLGTSYQIVRTTMIKNGWQPVKLQGTEGCQDYDARCKPFKETILCSGIGRATCQFSWQKNQQYALVYTVGEDRLEFDLIEFCNRIALQPFTECRKS